MFPALDLPHPESENEALVLASGPSYDDYDLRNEPGMLTPRSRYATYGCGLMYLDFWPKNYVVGDWTRWKKVLDEQPWPDHPVTIWSFSDCLEYVTKNKDRMPEYMTIKEIPERPPWLCSTGILAIHTAQLHHSRTLVLGIDGGHCVNGTPRRRCHAPRFIEPWDNIWEEQTQNLTQDITCVAASLCSSWNNVYNISTTSCLHNVLPTLGTKEKYNNYDRYGNAIFFFTTPGGVDPHFPCIYAMRFRKNESGPRVPILAVGPCPFPEYVNEGKLKEDDVLVLDNAWNTMRCQFTHTLIIGDRNECMSF